SANTIGDSLTLVISRPLSKLRILNVLAEENARKNCLVKRRPTTTSQVSTISIEILKASTRTQFQRNTHLSVRDFLYVTLLDVGVELIISLKQDTNLRDDTLKFERSNLRFNNGHFV